MGVVWRATDSNLDRDVAIKLLPDSMKQAGDRLVRFEREARLLASISHPNIAVVHGLHEIEDTRFLAMELVPGEDLEVRLGRGRLSLEETLKIALPIADALEAAHEQGVVHRDLKPANVIVTPDGSVKVLDFGLAKSFEASDGEGDLTNSPTMTSAGTMAGVILGTAGYMAPEQAKGHLVDRRADIWAFGVLLFEMLSGTRMYDESTVSEALAAVLLKEPEWERLPAETPAALERLVRRCLIKDPRARLRDMGEARIALEGLIRGDEEAAVEASPPTTSKGGQWIAAALLVGVLLGLGATRLFLPTGSEPTPRTALALAIDIPQALQDARNPVVSPDGKVVVYLGIGSDDVFLYRRDLASGETEQIPGTGGATNPFFSPDGRWLGFFNEGGLKKIAMIGGDPLSILDGLLANSPGAAWLEDGSILYSGWLTGFSRVSSDGGAPEVLTIPDATRGETAHWWPQPLPGGRHVLFTVWPKGSGINDAMIAVLDLRDNSWSTLFSGARAAFAAPDRVLFYRAGNYLEARIDPSSLEILGEPTPVRYPIEKQYPLASQRQTFALGPGNMLVYLADESLFPLRSLVWFDRDGTRTPIPGDDRAIEALDLSPDGRQLVTTEFESGRFTLFLNDLRGRTREQLRLEGSNFNARWRPDGTHLSYAALRRGNFDVFMSRLDGSDEQVLLERDLDEEMLEWFSDGRRFLALLSGEQSWFIEEFDREHGPIRTLGGREFSGKQIDISRDDTWFALSAGQSGVGELYVQRTDGSAARTRVSPRGGSDPLFSPVRDELFYFRGNQVVAVDYEVTDGEFVVGNHNVMFEVSGVRGSMGRRWAVSPDGQRFLVLQPGQAGSTRPEMRIVFDW